MSASVSTRPKYVVYAAVPASIYGQNASRFWIAETNSVTEAKQLVVDPKLSPEAMSALRVGHAFVAIYQDKTILLDDGKPLSRVAALGIVTKKARERGKPRILRCTNSGVFNGSKKVPFSELKLIDVPDVTVRPNYSKRSGYGKDWLKFLETERTPALVDACLKLGIDVRLVVMAMLGFSADRTRARIQEAMPWDEDGNKRAVNLIRGWLDGWTTEACSDYLDCEELNANNRVSPVIEDVKEIVRKAHQNTITRGRMDAIVSDERMYDEEYDGDCYDDSDDSDDYDDITGLYDTQDRLMSPPNFIKDIGLLDFTWAVASYPASPVIAAYDR